MGQDCKDCAYMKNLSERTKDLEETVKNFEIRITSTEKKLAVERERTDMIFKILTEIKDSIKEISNKMELVERRPSKVMTSIATAAGASVLTAIILAGIKYIK